MLKIGEFSKLSKVTIKALRYYEKEGLLLPAFINEENGYRFYDNSQLVEIAKIIAYRQMGLSIDEIKQILDKSISLNTVLLNKQRELEETINNNVYQLSKIKYFLEEKEMTNEIFEKEISECYVYYKEGIIPTYSDMTEFILESGTECMNLNPGIKCIEPDYCFVEYLDGEYKENDVKIRYSQAVVPGQYNSNGAIKFKKLEATKCICIYHKGAYDSLGSSYSKIMNYISANNLKMSRFPRECYIDGIWNKENPEDWLTEIQIPIE